VFREVPVPRQLIELIDVQHGLSRQSAAHPLWSLAGQPLHRVTAYRWVKSTMADAGIHGAQACPKGLRHGYGIHAIQSGVPVTLLQKWLGHASLSTTAIYTNALGAEELYIAERMWV
jgi:site-specific recombinase XerD